jgi:hypothetical protein
MMSGGSRPPGHPPPCRDRDAESWGSTSPKGPANFLTRAHDALSISPDRCNMPLIDESYDFLPCAFNLFPPLLPSPIATNIRCARDMPFPRLRMQKAIIEC